MLEGILQSWLEQNKNPDRSCVFEERLGKAEEFKKQGNETYQSGDQTQFKKALDFYLQAMYQLNFDELQFNFELQIDHQEVVYKVLFPILLNAAQVSLSLENYRQAHDCCQ